MSNAIAIDESDLVGRTVVIGGADWEVVRVATWSPQYVILSRQVGGLIAATEMARSAGLVRAALAWQTRPTVCPGCGSTTTPTTTTRCAEKIEFFACPDCDFSSWEPRDWTPATARPTAEPV